MIAQPEALQSTPRYAPKRETRNPCAICGWDAQMGIHTFEPEAYGKPPFYAHEYTPYGITGKKK